MLRPHLEEKSIVITNTLVEPQIRWLGKEPETVITSVIPALLAGPVIADPCAA